MAGHPPTETAGRGMPVVSGRLTACPDDGRSPSAADGGFFPPTAWSMVLGAMDGATPEALLALDRLARAYWRPLFIFARQRGHGADEAADSVQGFFAHLLSRDFLRNVHPEAGRFRTFLLTCFTRWMRDQWACSQADKRGAGTAPMSLEELGPLGDSIPAEDELPEDAFDREWAHEVLALARRRLGKEWSTRSEILMALGSCLVGGSEPAGSYAEIGRRLGMTEGAVKKAAYDLRQDLGRLVRLEIRRTVVCEAEVQDELRHLVRLLRR